MGGNTGQFHWDEKVKGLEIALEACGDLEGRETIKELIKKRKKEIAENARRRT